MLVNVQSGSKMFKHLTLHFIKKINKTTFILRILRVFGEGEMKCVGEIEFRFDHDAKLKCKSPFPFLNCKLE